ADAVLRFARPPPDLFVIQLAETVLNSLVGFTEFLRCLAAHGNSQDLSCRRVSHGTSLRGESSQLRKRVSNQGRIATIPGRSGARADFGPLFGRKRLISLPVRDRRDQYSPHVREPELPSIPGTRENRSSF